MTPTSTSSLQRRPGSWKSWIWLTPLVFAAGLWATPQLLKKPAAAPPEHEEHAEAPAIALTAAEIVTVTGQLLPATIKASGMLEPLSDGRALITPEAPGLLHSFTLKPGDRVTAGQVVARVQRHDLDTVIQEKQAAVIEARRQVLALTAKLPLEESSLDAQRRTAQADEQTAQARLDRLKGGNRPEEIERAEAQVATAQADLERLRNGALPQERRQSEAMVREARAEVEVATKAAARSARLVEAGVAPMRERERADADLTRARERQASLEAALALVVDGTRPELIRSQEEKVHDLQAQVRLLRQGFRPEEIREAEAAVEALQAKQAEVEARRRQLSVLAADVAAARERVHQAEAAVETARAMKSQTVVRAPINGIVSAVSAVAGEVVQPGRSLAELTSDAELRLLLQVPTANQASLRPGIPVLVTLSHEPQARYTGSLRVVTPAANPETGTVTAEVWLSNTSRTLRAGLVVNGEIRIGQARTLPAVPAGSVFSLNGEHYVWLLTPEGKVRQTQVNLGVERDGRAQILAGLKVGDQVLRDGRRSIADEMPYTVGGAPSPTPEASTP